MSIKYFKGPGSGMLVGVIALGATMLATLSSANAGSVLRLTSSLGGSITIMDGGFNDINPMVGAISFMGSIAGWGVNMSSGFSKPLVGDSAEAVLDISSFNLSDGAGTLTIEFTDNGFTIPLASHWMSTSAIGGTTSGTVTYDTYRDAGNALFGLTEHLDSFGPLGSVAFAAENSMNLTALEDPFSLTQVITIVHGGAGMTGFNAELTDPPPAPMPEPGTLALFGLGLAGLGFARRRKAA